MSIGPLGTNLSVFFSNKNLFIHENASENIVCEMAAIFSMVVVVVVVVVVVCVCVCVGGGGGGGGSFLDLDQGGSHGADATCNINLFS